MKPGLTSSPFGDRWRLNPTIAFLNHGSFGATPIDVLLSQRAMRDALEADPIRFLAPERELEPKLDTVRARVAELVIADPQDIAFVKNATDGINAVLRSFPFENDDEIVVTNHGYNACNNAARFAAELSGAKVVVADIPFPINDPREVVDAIEAVLSTKTRLLLVDHVTSFSGLIFPLAKIIDLAHGRDIRVLVDGAHAPGMLPVNLRQLRPDYYTANHHKWLCGPKVSGFLYVDRRWQSQVRPTVISHAANRSRPNRSRFLAEFDWTGTYDPTPLLVMPHAIDFLSNLYPEGYEAYMQSNHRLALQARQLLVDQLQCTPPAPESMIGSLVTLPLPTGPGADTMGIDSLQQILFHRYQIEVPILSGPHRPSRWVRVSCQAYNDIEQYRQLGEALRHELSFA